jgi:hypothetical protein
MHISVQLVSSERQTLGLFHLHRTVVSLFIHTTHAELSSKSFLRTSRLMYRSDQSVETNVVYSEIYSE